jgi:hypothetical protein
MCVTTSLNIEVKFASVSQHNTRIIFQNVHTGSEAHSVFCSMDTGFFSGSKTAGA